MAGESTSGPRPALGRFVAVLAVVAALAAVPAAAVAGLPRGVDVSRFQGGIDWPAVAETKVSFVFAQASRGSGDDCLVRRGRCGADNFYRRNVTGAQAAGLPIGPYHRAFASGRTRARAKADARREARVFSRAVEEAGDFDLRPVLDVESPFTRLDPGRLRLWIRTWLERVERKLGVKPIIYTNATSWSETGDTLRFARRGYRLWVANFGVSSPLVPAGNWAGRGWSIWQFTSGGSVRGIDGNVDKNRLGVPLGRIEAR
jgi:GH25 family lysozyme M1 (1,4-beta-N-acetylmuramidase)